MTLLRTVSNYKFRRRDDTQRHDDHKMERKSASFENGAWRHQGTCGDIMKFTSSFEIKKVMSVDPETKGAFTRVPQVDQRGWTNEIEFNGWTMLFTQFHKGEPGSRFQNGGKLTCAGKVLLLYVTI